MVLDRSAEPNTRLNALLFFGDFSSMRSEIYFFAQIALVVNNCFLP